MDSRIDRLERISIAVPAEALEAFEAALDACCRSVSFFLDEVNDRWVIEGLREIGESEDALATAMMLAEAASGITPVIERGVVPVGGWLARSFAAFPEQIIGRHFAIRGSHVESPKIPGRITISLDAGLAFGSGEHESTRGCLLALERIARGKHPMRILDLGTGSGVLAIAAARLLHRPVLASDIDPRSVQVAAQNAARNGVAALVSVVKTNGWQSRKLRRDAPYDLVFANILARPLAAMAHQLATRLAPGGTVILSGLLGAQERFVLAAHRRHGLALAYRIRSGAWSTLVLRKPDRSEAGV